MKIGVISDTHIPDRAEAIPKEILEAFRSADMIIHAGDLVQMNVLDQLKKVCPDVRAVYGNMDPYDVRGKLAEKEVITIGKHRIGLMHGYGAPVNLIELLKKNFRDDFVEMIIFGHSHSPVNEIVDGILFFNPGSATDKLFSPYNSYGLIEINDKIEAKIVKI